ncbi:MAG: hypothetical protein IT212_06740 [Bacteroidia bacterium]|nr:hypothetical protein [Bacteroidia bacterium]
MPDPILHVLPFNAENLAEAFSNRLTPPTAVKEKMHYRYFFEYLGDTHDSLNAQTIVIESKYISRSYLMDYSSYYSTCFSDYNRFCKRVHFFSKKFSEERFIAALKRRTAEDNHDIWENYLGYIVIKPLPTLPVGATIVKTYANTIKDKRFFPTIKDYSVNLFGKELSIQSLAFQEQDSVVGACASSALWSAFHKTSQLFQTPLPSPSDITKSAKNLFQNSGRTFPNRGLDHYQIGNAIESVGLVSELRNNRNFTGRGIGYLKAFIYAYNRMGLPVLLGITFKEIGSHLITITGYKESNDNSFGRTSDISLKASKIERLYAHDDQIGPFSKLGFTADGDIETSWVDPDDKAKRRIAKFDSLFIPLHNKIRLTFENIYAKVAWVDYYFFKRLPTVEVYWDIYLEFSNEYKKSVYSSELPDFLKLQLLTEPMPKYVWIAKGLINNECVIELLFDATQIASADSCIKINVHNTSLRVILKDELTAEVNKEYFISVLGASFFDELIFESCY